MAQLIEPSKHEALSSKPITANNNDNNNNNSNNNSEVSQRRNMFLANVS
jgi:hypothetical protein